MRGEEESGGRVHVCDTNFCSSCASSPRLQAAELVLAAPPWRGMITLLCLPSPRHSGVVQGRITARRLQHHVVVSAVPPNTHRLRFSSREARPLPLSHPIPPPKFKETTVQEAMSPNDLLMSGRRPTRTTIYAGHSHAILQGACGRATNAVYFKSCLPVVWRAGRTRRELLTFPQLSQPEGGRGLLT